MRHCLKTNVESTKERYPRATSGVHICTLRHMFLQLLTFIYTIHFLVCVHITLITCTYTPYTPHNDVKTKEIENWIKDRA